MIVRPVPGRTSDATRPTRPNMSRKLILFRHAKSDWKGPFRHDLERALNTRGERAARTMGRLLALSGQLPDVALTSPAVRARETLELASKAGSWTCAIEEDRELYDSSPRRVLDVIRRTSDSCRRLMLVGHEPTWSQLASLLIGEGGQLRFVTASMARMDFRLDSWKDIAFGSGELVWLLQPRFFTDGQFEGLLE